MNTHAIETRAGDDSRQRLERLSATADRCDPRGERILTTTTPQEEA